MAESVNHLLTAMNHHLAGEFQLAEPHYRQHLASNPMDVEALRLFSILALQAGQLQSSQYCSQQAETAAQAKANFYHSLALMLEQQGHWESALQVFGMALHLHPTYAEAHSNLGNLLRSLGYFEEAVQHYRQAIQLLPTSAEAHHNLGYALECNWLLKEAVVCYQKALSLNPELLPSLNNLANVYQMQGRFPEAIALYQFIIGKQPDNAEAHNNLGYALQAEAEIENALQHYDQAVTLKPDYADAHCNKAIAYLVDGRFEVGWRQYEWRLQKPSFALRNISKSPWNGSNIQGKRLLVLTEQGFGDSFQFTRYLPLLKAQGATIILETYPELMTVFENCPGVDEIVERNHPYCPQVDFDEYVYLMSLPLIFNTTLQNIPPPLSGFPVKPHLADQWQQRLAEDTNLKIGIAWSGNLKNPWNLYRSCQLKHFEALRHIPGVTFYSLQKGPPVEQLEQPDLQLNVIDLGNTFQDFSDTAAAMAQLDLIISVDTAIVHLAGNLGKPVWLLCSYTPDWRWMWHREDSPWYPLLRLFRQPVHNDWKSVFQTVQVELAQWQANYALDKKPSYHPKKPLVS